MELPSGFLPLREKLSASDNKDACFIGAITHIQAPVQVNKAGGEYILNFALRDKFPGDEKDSVSCILKRRKAEWLPQGEPGDVAILRNMKVDILGVPPKPTLVNDSEYQSQALFFPAKNIPAPEFGNGYHSGGNSKLPFSPMRDSRPPSSPEQMAVINMNAAAAPLYEELKEPNARFFARIGPSKASAKTVKKQNLISDMTAGIFCNLVGEVVKEFSATSDSVDLYVTDYTTNKDLFLYEEKDDYDSYSGGPKKPWPGPRGQMTVQIRLYEPHATAARNIVPGDIVFLQNIRPRFSQFNKLEGAIHADPKYPEKIGIRKCTNPGQLADLEERRAEYEKQHASVVPGRDEPTNVPKKPSAKASAKKKLSKKEKKRLQKEQEQKELEEKAQGTEGMNKNIRAGDHLVPFSTVDEIVHNPFLKTMTEKGEELTLPFVNSKYRARLRVVDHYPLQLKKFTRIKSSPPPTQASTSTSSKDDSQTSKGGSQGSWYAWHFFLLVEDADAPAGTIPTRFPLTIDTVRAQMLLKMDPFDLSACPDKLKLLEEKLFLLWGNLHERKIALKKQGINLPLPVGDSRLALSNKPFECCIEEYGVPVNGKGIPFTDKDMKNILEGDESLMVDILGNPGTWKRTWSPCNTIINDA